jgi:hypothetical protein
VSSDRRHLSESLDNANRGGAASRGRPTHCTKRPVKSAELHEGSLAAMMRPCVFNRGWDGRFGWWGVRRRRAWRPRATAAPVV